VNVVGCPTIEVARNPVERPGIERAHPITKQGWSETVSETAHEFHDTVIDMNPILRDQDVLQQIRNETERVEDFAQIDND
jgi:hypothetical protein